MAEPRRSVLTSVALALTLSACGHPSGSADLTITGDDLPHTSFTATSTECSMESVGGERFQRLLAYGEDGARLLATRYPEDPGRGYFSVSWPEWGVVPFGAQDGQVTWDGETYTFEAAAGFASDSGATTGDPVTVSGTASCT